MTTSPYLLVNGGGVIQNVILWDGVTAYTPPPGQTLVPLPAGQTAQAGDTWNGTNVVPQPPSVLPGNLATIMSKVQGALANNDAYLAIGSPTTAQAIAQVAALTRQVDALARFVFNQLQSVSDV